MAQNPEFYISVICDVFKAASKEINEPTKEQQARAGAGYGLLRSFKTIPGEKDGIVDLVPLRAWIQDVRKRAAQVDRTRIVDQYIGHLLAHAPSEKADGAWPDRSIRILLDELDSNDIENGLLIERLICAESLRGPFSTGVVRSVHLRSSTELGLRQQHTSREPLQC